MKFENALQQLRQGKKIRHPIFPDNEYLMGCYVSLIFSDETFEEKKARGMSIVKMKGDKEHPDMRPTYNPSLPYHGPCVPLLTLMMDNWEVME